MAEGDLLTKLGPDGRDLPRCGRCGERAAYRDTRPERRFRHVPLWGMAVPLAYAPRRLSCPPCGGAQVEAMPSVSGKDRRTCAMAVVLATWARILSWKQVAALFHVAWGAVADAVEEGVAYGLAHQDLSDVTHTSRGCSGAIRVTS